MNAGAISKLLYGFVSVQAIIHSLNLVDYLPVQTHKQELLLVSCSYYVYRRTNKNFCLYHVLTMFSV